MFKRNKLFFLIVAGLACSTSGYSIHSAKCSSSYCCNNLSGDCNSADTEPTGNGLQVSMNPGRIVYIDISCANGVISAYSWQSETNSSSAKIDCFEKVGQIDHSSIIELECSNYYRESNEFQLKDITCQ